MGTLNPPARLTETTELGVILSSYISAATMLPPWGSHPVPPQLQSSLCSTAIKFLETSAYFIVPSAILLLVTAFEAILPLVTAEDAILAPVTEPSLISFVPSPLIPTH